MTTTVKLAPKAKKFLKDLKLDSGGHNSVEKGSCLLEAASYVAGEPWSDHPKCVSQVLGAFGRHLNDGLSDENRQKLIPFIPLLLSTADDGQDPARRRMAADWSIRVGTPRWLDAAGLTDAAARLRALAPIVDDATMYAAQSEARKARDEAYAARTRSRAALADKIKAEWEKRGWKTAAAVAVADAAADAAADAVTATIAVAVAAAVAAADADADAIADAVTATIADAVAVAVAAAVAAADADADAIAAAAAAAAADFKTFAYPSPGYFVVRDAVYKVLKPKYDAAMGDESKFAELVRLNNADGIELLGRMINPTVASHSLAGFGGI